MITKFKSIKNLAVFNNFDWDTSVRARNGRVSTFRRINILYGHNYSGKTTLSRIARAFETGALSDKFEHAEFELEFEDASNATQADLASHPSLFRVFNEDFVRENLRFIFNPEEDIEAFAVLGSGNNAIEREIEALRSVLGANEEGKESGLYKDLKDAARVLSEDQDKVDLAVGTLEEQVKKKAIDRSAGIKYKSDRFGDQNYTTAKLNRELEVVTGPEYSLPSGDALTRWDTLLRENAKATIPVYSTPRLVSRTIAEKTKELVERKIVESNKIEELVMDAVLNRWVGEGRLLHKDKRDHCAFCGNAISPDRWLELDKHFDKESENLQKEIENLIAEITAEKDNVSSALSFQISDFYSEFHAQLNDLTDQFQVALKRYVSSLDNAKRQLERRKDSIITPFDYEELSDESPQISAVFDSLERIRVKSNDYSATLATDQSAAKEGLRLKEVYDFATTIGYVAECQRIEQLEGHLHIAEQKHNNSEAIVASKVAELDSKMRLLNDEEEGARKVNKYLNDYFGHKFLSLEAIETTLPTAEQTKKIRFEIKRDGAKAHHLSEGECSLISFCYFIAKLEDTATKGHKPVIWIDDPISSLDNNHVFFLFSIIKSQIVDTGSFEQLFISTHSLEFLKYLKRLGGGSATQGGTFQSFDRSYFLIQRNDRVSEIQMMPKHLKDYVTEFNYLFGQIYTCSTISAITDKNYTAFYNFGNNARKFLEIYLFYRFPDKTSEFEKLRRFFGDKPIPAVLTERINNEYSHLASCFERGAIPVDAPEMKSAARLIVDQIRTTDQAQYDALINSLG